MRTEPDGEKLVDLAFTWVGRVCRLIESLPLPFCVAYGLVGGLIIVFPFAFILFIGIMVHLIVGAVHG